MRGAELESVLTVVGGRVVYAAAPFQGFAPPALPPVSPGWSPVAHFGGYQNPRRALAPPGPPQRPPRSRSSDEDYMHLGNSAARTGSPLAFEAIKYIRLGYTFAAVPLRPRLALRADVVSGDRTQLTAPSARLTPCSPRGNYFGEAATLGPHNLVDLHPMLQLHLSERVSREAGWTYYWRYSRRDGVYGTA